MNGEWLWPAPLTFRDFFPLKNDLLLDKKRESRATAITKDWFRRERKGDQRCENERVVGQREKNESVTGHHMCLRGLRVDVRHRRGYRSAGSRKRVVEHFLDLLGRLGLGRVGDRVQAGDHYNATPT